MEKKHLCYLVAFVLFASCSSNESKNSTLKNICKINIDNIQKKDTIFLSNYFKKVKFIELETTDESLIGSFDGMIIHNDLIYIKDIWSAQRIFVFDKQGRFIRKIGQKGVGPNEYLSISDFTIDDITNTLLICDYDSKKIFKYNIETGEFLESVKIKSNDIFINDIVTIKENILVNAIYYDNRTDPRFMLHVIDKDNGNILKRWMNVNDFNCNWNELVSRQGGFFYSKGQTPIKYTNFFNNIIYEITENGPNPYIMLESKNWVSCEDIKEMANNSKHIREVYDEVIKRKFDFNISDFVEIDNLIFLDFMRGQDIIKIVYDKNTKKAILSYNLFDDFIFDTFRIPCLKKVYSDKSGMYTVVRPESIPYFIDFLNKYSIKSESAVLLSKRQLSTESNPILIYYEK